MLLNVYFIIKKFQIFWSNYKLDLRSYSQLLSLFSLKIPYFCFVKEREDLMASLLKEKEEMDTRFNILLFTYRNIYSQIWFVLNRCWIMFMGILSAFFANLCFQNFNHLKWQQIISMKKISAKKKYLWYILLLEEYNCKLVLVLISSLYTRLYHL